LRRPTVTYAGSAASPAQFPRDGLPEVAFLGRSNVGKSSLLNAMAGVRGLAKVSSTPGRTRLVSFFRVGSEMYLADLPGYGYARVSRDLRAGWERLATSYLLARPPLALCVLLVDARHDPGDGDSTLVEWLDYHGLSYVVAANKVDKLGRGSARARMAALGDWLEGRRTAPAIAVSAETGLGLDDLWRTVRTAVATHRED
jgi:GTP-binding protein